VDTETEVSTSGSEGGETAAAGECRFMEAAAAARSSPVCTQL